MTTEAPWAKTLKQFEDIDIDELLSQLTPEQLEELNSDVDPDNSSLPASQRMKDQTEKEPTGPYDREKLMTFLEKKAKEEKDWEQNKPYVKETRGKVWTPKETPKPTEEEEEINTEWDDVLNDASEDDLVELAAILGFTGIMNQVQFHNAYVEEPHNKAGGFHAAAKAELIKALPDEPPNTTDVEDAMAKLRANDPKLKELNLNNIKNISIERLCLIADTLKENTNLETMCLANTAASDKVVKSLAEALKENKTLKTLVLDSNYISGEAMVELLTAINVNQTVTELSLANQRPATLGVKSEMAITKLLSENKTLLKIGLHFETNNARVVATAHIKSNIDALRQDRVK